MYVIYPYLNRKLFG